MAKWVEGLDYAWTHVPIKAALAYGAEFMCRYVSPDSGKNLSSDEAVALAKAGIWMTVVWESTANRASEGFLSGVADAHEALKQAKKLGMPDDRPIYFAVDYDSPGSDVEAYFKGVTSVLTVRRTGIYGGLRAVRYIHNKGWANWVWQTYAWSGGIWHDKTHIRQYNNNIRVGGVDCDANRALMPDFGQWMPGKSPVNPQPTKEKDVQYGQLKNGPGAKDVFAVPQGSGTNIAFGADNGLQNLPPALIRVAIRDKDGWDVHQISVDGMPVGKNGKPNPVQTVVKFRDPKTTGIISIRREDTGDVNVGWEVS